MTQLPHNPLITVIDLPEYIISRRMAIEYLLGRFKISPSTYKLICLGNQATEEEAREIVEAWDDSEDSFKDYGYISNHGEESYPFALPTASLRSLITANGWKNPVFLRNI